MGNVCTFFYGLYLTAKQRFRLTDVFVYETEYSTLNL